MDTNSPQPPTPLADALCAELRRVIVPLEVSGFLSLSSLRAVRLLMDTNAKEQRIFVRAIPELDSRGYTVIQRGEKT